jgi:RHS repeat-associated protein
LIDGSSRRVGKKVNGTLVKGFLYSGARLVAELNGAGAVVSRFVYAGGHVPAFLIKGGAVFRFITDQLGSVRLVVDSSNGTILQRIDYDSFGNIIQDTNPGFQPFGFAGGIYEAETALIHFSRRDYDPTTGRWTTKDPIWFEGGDSNLYLYAGADPVNSYDPVGEATLDAGSFPAGDEEQQLLTNVRLALTRLSGTAGSDDTWDRSPRRLRQNRDSLGDDYKDVWKNSTVRYDPNCPAATGNRNANGGADIVIGPWFLQKQFTKRGFTRQLEKIILHEYLHNALDKPFQFRGQADRNELQHGFINQVIQFNLGYPGSPNPGAP